MPEHKPRARASTRRGRLARACVAWAAVAAAGGCATRPLELGSDAALAAAVANVNGAGAEVVVAVGDVARCGRLQHAAATARVAAAVVARFPNTRVLTVGDHAYPRGTQRQFERCYEPTWGEHNARTAPSPGNHDYKTAAGAPFFDYFELFDREATARERGYYGFALDEWQIVALNSMIAIEAAAPQLAWLTRELEAANARCILAYWHHPRWSSSAHGRQRGDRGRDTAELWDTLAAHGAEIVINGHAHMYERFAPQTTSGAATERGIRQFVVGTGGASLDAAFRPLPNSEYLNADVHGVLVIVLHAASYEWNFIGVDGVVHDESAAPVDCR